VCSDLAADSAIVPKSVLTVVMHVIDLADDRVLDGEQPIRKPGCIERGRDDTINAWLSAR